MELVRQIDLHLQTMELSPLRRATQIWALQRLVVAEPLFFDQIPRAEFLDRQQHSQFGRF
jgi:hypothetical protein